MDANRSQFFSKRLATVAATYKPADPAPKQSFDMQATMNNLKVISTGGECDISLTTDDDAKVDISVKAGEIFDMAGVQFSKLAFKQGTGTITDLRIFAWI